MTDEQIVKAWGKCIDVTSGCCGDDTTCPYCTDEEEGCAKCFEKLRIDVLALIKRQQAEIERYKGVIRLLEKDVADAKAEAVREFAERLTKHLSYSHSEEEQLQNLIIRNAIDALLKKMTEEMK